jgi:hypothetical protein
MIELVKERSDYMSEEVLATSVGLARNEVINHTQLMELAQNGSKRRMKRIPDAPVATPQASPVAAPAPVEEKVDNRTEWQKAGFTPIYEGLINHFEKLRASHVLSADVRSVIQSTESATTVEEFDIYNDAQLVNMIDTVRNQLPRIHQEMNAFIDQVNTVRPMIIETDFI